jgi:tetratricopeptide (TPR) repeat protein
MPHISRPVLVAMAILALPGWAGACLWDSDTLQQERMRFPSTLELIAGKFLRHSPEFYEWRIRDREERVKADPSNLPLYDDLAVAYSKTGKYELAVATMMKKEVIQPGLYETYSNLGTFHILAGEFEKGLPYIDKALAINPDAHFGREKYQKWLVEYALSKKKDGKITFPLRGGEESTLARHLDKSHEHSRHFEDLQSAIKGILGMMRFANHDYPLLLEALGDLLSSPWDPTRDAKRLAARAYLQASYVVLDPVAKTRYREFAKQALMMQTGVTFDGLESDLKQELAEANEWYAGVKAKELEWIRDGKNPEAEFNALYVNEPEFPNNATPFAAAWWRKNLDAMLIGSGAILLLAAISLLSIRRM